MTTSVSDSKLHIPGLPLKMAVTPAVNTSSPTIITASCIMSRTIDAVLRSVLKAPNTGSPKEIHEAIIVRSIAIRTLLRSECICEP